MNVALPPSPEAAPTADATPAAAASTSTTPTAETTTPAEAPVSPPSAPTATSSEATLENFHKKMKSERHGYRPTAYFKTVEDARASHHDLNRTEAYVSVKHGGFTADELAAIPDNAKQKNYYIGFAKQMLDSSEGIFTKKFWTSFEGIKKVLTAGIIKGEVEEVRLEAAEWLVSKRGAGAPAAPSSPEVIEAPAATADTKARVVETKKLDTAALQEIEKRIQKNLETLRGRIVPETITVRVDDEKALETVAQIQRYGAGFNTGFDVQIKKVNDAFEAIGKIDLVKPQSAIEFRKGQAKALEKIDALSFGKDNVEAIAKNVDGGLEKLPHSMREAITKSDDILEQIKNDLGEARRLIETARRAKLQSTESKGEVQTGSVAKMPRLGNDLTIDPRKLELMGHAMVDANISDKDLNGWYKMVMSEFVKSYVGTFSKVRKEIYEARMDGSNMTEMQKEKFKFLADELGTEVKVSDLVQLDYSKFSLPFTEDLDSRFRRVIDGSKFQKALNQMKAEFAAALTKEIEKVPGTENTDTTYVAFKRQTFEKSGVTDFFAKN
jgi:hypothetical protein